MDALTFQEKLIKESMEGNTENVRMLLDEKADINYRDLCRKRTPLLWASHYGKKNTVKLLLERKADISIKESSFNCKLYTREIRELIDEQRRKNKIEEIQNILITEVEYSDGNIRTIFPFPTTSGGHILIFKLISEYAVK